MHNPVIAGRALAALDELERWKVTLAVQREAELDVLRTRPFAKVVFAEFDPLADEGPRPHLAVIKALASEVLAQHRYYASNPHTEEARQQHTDAAAAWRLVLSARTFPDAEARVLLAARKSSEIVPRIKKLAGTLLTLAC